MASLAQRFGQAVANAEKKVIASDPQSPLPPPAATPRSRAVSRVSGNRTRRSGLGATNRSSRSARASTAQPSSRKVASARDTSRSALQSSAREALDSARSNSSYKRHIAETRKLVGTSVVRRMASCTTTYS